MNQITETTSYDFQFVSDDLKLSGTIEKPSRTAPKGSILLLSGSGPQDRDESIAGKKPFLELSHALASWGYVVFRWDDRGVGKSDGDYFAASAESLVGDVISAMSAIERETGFARHTLVGHSQGTLIAAAVAANRPSDVGGLVLLAGMGLPGRESLLDQHVRICQAEGMPDDDIRPSLAQKEALFDILIDTQSDIDAGMPVAQALQNLRATLLGVFLGDIRISDISEYDRDELGSVIESLLEWEWRYLLCVDPSTNLLQVTCPVLAVVGDRDAHVEAERNLAAIESACVRGLVPEVEVQVLPDHNHLFQATKSGALSAYETLGSPFADGLLSVVRSWLSRNEARMGNAD